MAKHNIDALTTVYAEYFNNLYKLPKAGTPEHKKAYQALRDRLQDNLKTLGIATNFDFELVLVGAASKETAKTQTPAKGEAKPKAEPAKAETKNNKPAEIAIKLEKAKKQTPAKAAPKQEAKAEKPKAQTPAKAAAKVSEKKAPRKMLFTKGIFANNKLNGSKAVANRKA